MEKNEMRELNLDEMDKVSGGMHDAKENRRYEFFEGGYCTHCRKYFRTDKELNDHIKTEHS